MPSSLSADIAIVNIAGGRPLPDEPAGLATFAAPRKAARGREKDTLYLCLSLRSRTALPAERYTELLHLAAATFFGSSGSITAAARQAIATVNQRLLEANLREGAPVQGGLICAALRQTDFYAVQSGPGVLVVAHENAVERFPSAASRPLGLSDALDAHYFHTTVSAGEYFALSGNAHWSEAALVGLGGLATLSAVAERLKASASGDFSALIARLEPDRALATAPPPAPMPGGEPAPRPRLNLPLPPSLGERLRGTPRPEPEPTRAPEPPAPVAEPVSTREPLIAPSPANAGPRRTATTTQPSVQPSPAASAPPVDEDFEPAPFKREARPPRVDTVRLLERVQPGLRSFGRALGVTLTEAVRSLRRLLARMLPEGMLQREGMFTVPTSVLIGTAIVLPLIVVGVAALVYIQYGQAQRFEAHLQQAQFAIARARTAPDALAARPYWEAALIQIEQAEQLQPDNPEIAQLRQEVQGQLDTVTWTTRLSYQPLLPGGTGTGVPITRLVPTGIDVYALDAEQRQVWRLLQTASGVYTIDPSFQCASGTIGPLTVGPLVDIGYVAGPNVRDADAVIALDNAGALMYCSPGEGPLVSYLPAPDTGWAMPIALDQFGDSLYVLDIGQNQLWQFQASGGVYSQAPLRYFSDVIYDLKDVVDFTIANGEVMLLRRDGRIATCNRPALTMGATCTEAARFTDSRPGRSDGDRLADVTAPKAIVFDQPPEPSIFLLNPERQALAQLSLKLNFVRQYQPARPLPAAISALAIDRDKRLFIGAGDNVYVASRP